MVRESKNFSSWKWNVATSHEKIFLIFSTDLSRFKKFDGLSASISDRIKQSECYFEEETASRPPVVTSDNCYIAT